MSRLVIGAGSLIVAAGLLVPVLARAQGSTDCGPNENPRDNCKTVAVDDAGRLTSPTTAGTVGFFSLKPSTTYGVIDAIEALPRSKGGFDQGDYILTWAGKCSDGTASGAAYSVGAGGSYPKTPPSTTPSPTGASITTDASGNFVCAYTLAYPSKVPAGAVSVRNDFWVLDQSTGEVKTQVASESVPPGGSIKAPETFLAILIPIGVLGLVGGFLAVRLRRQPLPGS